MPDQRLARARETLPKGYQFGDAKPSLPSAESVLKQLILGDPAAYNAWLLSGLFDYNQTITAPAYPLAATWPMLKRCQ